MERRHRGRGRSAVAFSGVASPLSSGLPVSCGLDKLQHIRITSQSGYDRLSHTPVLVLKNNPQLPTHLDAQSYSLLQFLLVGGHSRLASRKIDLLNISLSDVLDN